MRAPAGVRGMSERAGKSRWDRGGTIRAALEQVALPRMATIRQRFADTRIADIPGAVAAELSRAEIAQVIAPGMSIAITAGSRGIAHIDVILREIAGGVKRLGARPFLVPAMGSHGGATVPGQLQILQSYGITEDRIGAPIRATMETRAIGRTGEGHPVHIDRFAAEADGIIVVGRIKPHTSFHGPFESGLMKMMAIGLGKHRGAEICHAAGFGRFPQMVPDFGRAVLSGTNILFGVGIVENAYDETFRIEAVPKGAIETREPELLEEARRLMPSIPFPEFDILVVDRIGKNFSGDGADPNITGTYGTPYASGGPRFQRYVVLDLSDETHGNGLGVGMADITTARLFDKADFGAMYVNSLTNRVLNVVRIPMVLDSDKLALQAAVSTCLGIDPNKPRIVRIANTSRLDVLSISEALLPVAKDNPDISIRGSPLDIRFGPGGEIYPLIAD
jgi:hypothetical protein